MPVAVVTGGGSGIGAAIARALACNGHDLTLVGRRSVPLEVTAGHIAAAAERPVRWLPLDLTQPADAEALADIGKVDVLVCAAGAVLDPGGDSLADVAACWRANFDANVLTAVMAVEALADQIRPGGAVGLVGSIAAQRGGRGPYGAAKAALHGYLYDLAARLGPRGVTVNLVCPGYVDGTDLFGGPPSDVDMARRVGETLTGRVGTPQDIADAVLFLVQARHVTGQIIAVNGGAVLGR